ncbi:uncharacterized protein LOC125681766 isoform X2 [Ostrea edulis]|uniref:uncharacterized protein LOC125681766 isoform X2 n=1 Tax=Ostrea edulis TaxID=37623 RepID=UPI0024AF0F3F|nr:uncharacterized protein LOC125681766 isoform X2 [Ostrea edulis]
MATAVRSIVLLLLCQVCLSVGKPYRQTSGGIALTLSSSADGSYSLSINNVTFLTSQRFFVISNGTTYERTNITLNSTEKGSNTDERLGAYTYTKFTYIVPAQGNIVEAWIKDYSPKPFVTFELLYVDGMNGTRSTDCPPVTYPPTGTFLRCFNQTSAGFPSFQVQAASKTLGYLNLGGKMVGDYNKQLGIFGANTPKMTDGMAGGPLAVFDTDGNTILISPYDNFMVTSMWHDKAPGGTINWGIMGGVDSIPKTYYVKTVAVAASGINKAFQEYGSLLKLLYKTETERQRFQAKDVSLNFLGYWTDNGAYYYYHSESTANGLNKTLQDTLIDVQKYSESVGLTYGYIQIDSWWYYKGLHNAVKTWEARPDVFPDGIGFVNRKTGLPIVAHNRYWGPDVTYAKENDGNFTFVMEPFLSLPDDQSFWPALFKNSKKWGLAVYEQDWLNIQTLGLAALQTDLFLGERWMTEMGGAAQEQNITMQLCMSLPRHALQSVHLPAITQARVSEDYHLDPEQWRIGISSILTSAIGLTPYKDTFWSTRRQNGNPLYPAVTEPYPVLEVLVSTLSAGPVGPGDKINSSDVYFIMKCCDGNGRLLKPSLPATAIDRQIIKAAIPSADGPVGEVWTSYTTIISERPRDFGILMAANLSFPYTVKFSDTGFPDSLKQSLAFPFGLPDMWQPFDDDHPLVLDNCTREDFCLYLFSAREPGLNGTDIVIFGEISKWVPMSPERVTNIVHAEINMRVGIRGKPGEDVTMAFLINNSTRQSKCRIGSSGTAMLDAMYGCFPSPSPSYRPTSDLKTQNYYSSAIDIHKQGILLCMIITLWSLVIV